MSSNGQGRLIRSGMVSAQGLRYPIRQETANGSGLAEALGDFWWGGYPPTPTQIPHTWLTPPARWRPAPPSNTAAVTRTGGETARSTNRASVLALGERPYTAQLNTTVVDDPVNLASYVTTYYTAPRQRMPEVLLNLIARTPTECWLILERKVGDRISITGAPPPNLPLVTDTFSRFVTSGLGTSDSGQPWSTSGGSASDYNVVGGTQARISTTTTGTVYTALIDSGAPDFDITFDTAVPIVPGGDLIRTWVAGRAADTSNMYVARLEFQTTGNLTLRINKVVAGVESLVADAGSIGTHTAGAVWRTRFRGVRSTLQAKAWKTTTTAPTDWQTTATDTDLTSGTNVGARALRGSGNTDGTVNVDWDNLAVTTPNPTGWPDGVTELVIEGIEHTIGSDDARWARWKTAPVIGSTPGQAGPWFRLGESRTDGTDLLPF